MKIRLTVFFAALSSLIGASAISAHHGYAAYEMAKSVTLIGTVTHFEIANPHSSIYFDVKDEKGTVQHWGVEFGYVRALKDEGWARDTLKPGDQVAVTFHPSKNGSFIGAVSKVTYADGKPLPLNPPPQQ